MQRDEFEKVKNEHEMMKDEYEKMKVELELCRSEFKNFVILSAQSEVEMLKIHSLSHGRKAFNEDYFQNDDGKVRFFTGLTDWDILDKLDKFVNPFLNRHDCLTPFQQLALTLMRLRLGSLGPELGYHFGIHPSTVCRIFSDVIEVLYVRLKFLIVWPEREILRKTLPMDFRKNCPNCVAIIDCFEIFIDRPSDNFAQAQTYSSYKHHNTSKFLISVTPQGSVSYISSGWGGRTSDKYITENSSLLCKLMPGDKILADRGFDIQDSVGLHMATITMPAFTKGRSQLDAIEVEQSRTVSNLRIHVERIIGNIRKKYQILGGSTQIPMDFLISRPKLNNQTLLDMIVTVCCTFNNMCNSVVPFN